jgi:hypothetical protein
VLPGAVGRLPIRFDRPGASVTDSEPRPQEAFAEPSEPTDELQARPARLLRDDIK